MSRAHPGRERLTGDVPLASPERREVLEHVRDCERCRAVVAASDPTRLLALLALEPIPDELLERVSDSVSRSIDGPDGRPRRLRGVATASVAASLLLAALFSGYLLEQALQPVEPGPVGALGGAVVEQGEVELLDSPGDARLLDLTVGETQLVMIFDEALEI